MMRARVLLSLSAMAGVIGLAAACGGGDSGTSNPDDSDAGADGSSAFDGSTANDASTNDASTDAGSDATTANDASDASDAADASDSTSASDAPSDGPTSLDGSACDGGVIAVSNVNPLFAGTTAATPITITGTGFIQLPTVFLKSASGTLTQLSHVAMVNSTSLTADVPAGLTAGKYDIVVSNPSPSGCAASTSVPFTVVANPPPSILSVTPATGTTQTDASITVTGCHFPTSSGGTTLTSIDNNGGATATQTIASVVCSGAGNCADGSPVCTLKGTLGTTSLTAGDTYTLRVTNVADTSFADYSPFTVTDPSGKLVGNWAMAPALNVGRRSNGAVSGRVDAERRFLYAVGGEDATGAALRSVEMAPIDRYGVVGAWTLQRNVLQVPRSGLSLVRAGQYLYAIGGTSSTNGTGGNAPTGTPLGSIERARILDPNQAPVAQAAIDTSAGSLAAGTYYYKVSAILSAADVDNPNGETLPSDEVVATLSSSGKVTLTWPAVTGATGYLVYRSPTPTSFSQTEVLLASPGNVTTYVDGAATDAGAADAGADPSRTPLAVGSTGVWVTLAQTLVSPRLDAAAVVAPDSSGTDHLYVIGGYGTCPAATKGIMNCYEQAPLAAGDGSLTSFVPGTAALAHPRMREGADVLTSADGPATLTSDAGADAGPNNSAYIVVGGGAGLTSTGNTVEYALIGAAGAITSWQTVTGFSVERDGTRLAIANGYAYALFGGSPPNYKGTGDLSNRIEVMSSGALNLSQWSNAGANYSTGFGRYGLASESGFFYAIGGTTDDTDALAAVLSIVQ